MKNRIVKIIVLTAILTFILGFNVLAQDNIRIQVNGEEITFNGQQPLIQDGRVLVPVRGVFDALGYDIGWDGSEQMVTLTAQDGTVVSLWIGHHQLSFRSEVRIPRVNLITMDVPAQIINGSTMIPLRAVADAIGADVQWDGTQNMAIISYVEPHIHFTWGNGETRVYRVLEDGRLAEVISSGISIVSTGSFEYRLVRGMPADYADATFQNLLDMGYSFEGALDIFEEQIFILTNQERVNAGLQPLVWNDILARAARSHAQDIAINRVGHIGSDGSSARDRAVREGWDSGGVAENIGGTNGHRTTQSHVDGWMNSQVHRNTIMTQRVQPIGVGVWFVVENGRVTAGGAVQKFGR